MGLKKGQTNNPHGRKVGSKNKKTEQWNQLGEYLIGGAADRAMEIMSKSKDKEFMIHYGNLLNYFKPKQQSVNGNLSTGGDITIRVIRE